MARLWRSASPTTCESSSFSAGVGFGSMTASSSTSTPSTRTVITTTSRSPAALQRLAHVRQRVEMPHRHQHAAGARLGLAQREIRRREQLEGLAVGRARRGSSAWRSNAASVAVTASSIADAGPARRVDEHEQRQDRRKRSENHDELQRRSERAGRHGRPDPAARRRLLAPAQPAEREDLDDVGADQRDGVRAREPRDVAATGQQQQNRRRRDDIGEAACSCRTAGGWRRSTPGSPQRATGAAAWSSHRPGWRRRRG